MCDGDGDRDPLKVLERVVVLERELLSVPWRLAEGEREADVLCEAVFVVEAEVGVSVADGVALCNEDSDTDPLKLLERVVVLEREMLSVTWRLAEGAESLLEEVFVVEAVVGVQVVVGVDMCEGDGDTKPLKVLERDVVLKCESLFVDLP